ncbi:hypothetical protein XBI1_2670058 [Xenorhabdus bovienii str. Intermedium]|uniref:Uncharacterized protein n=1 Tax=Xenorhabdus bovienii str. Intermedium TaxID=1379677 RepID=A0A077QBG0_XENBV|nr:hypothetical protein XBI1_2670058 [Xenorhabdus bovienii str. Intermedium]
MINLIGNIEKIYFSKNENKKLIFEYFLQQKINQQSLKTTNH